MLSKIKKKLLIINTCLLISLSLMIIIAIISNVSGYISNKNLVISTITFLTFSLVLLQIEVKHKVKRHINNLIEKNKSFSCIKLYRYFLNFINALTIIIIVQISFAAGFISGLFLYTQLWNWVTFMASGIVLMINVIVFWNLLYECILKNTNSKQD